MIWTHVAAMIAGAGLAFAGAWTVQDWRYGAREAERLQRVAEHAHKNERSADKGAAGHEADRASIRTEFIPVTKEAERVIAKSVYRNVCLDVDGLRLLARIIDGQSSTGESAPTVPGPDKP